MPVKELSPELKEKARTELNEVEDKVQDDIQHIKDWLTEQPHLNARPDDQFILAFLRGFKFNLEMTKEKLDFLYTVRTMLPEFFTNRDPMAPEIQEVLKLGMFLPLINKDDALAPSIFLLRGIYDPEKIKMENVIKTHLMIMDVGIMDDHSILINGVHAVQDMDNCHMGHMPSPSFGKKVMTIFEEVYPNTQKGMHIFNLPSFFDTVFNIMKPLMSEETLNRMNIYRNGDDLFKKLPKKYFPVEYGGENGKIDDIANELKKKVESYRDWLLEDEKYGCDEKKRPGKPKTADEIFGIESSFRELQID